MRRTTLVVAALTLAAAVLAGCSGADEAGAPEGTAGPGTTLDPGTAEFCAALADLAAGEVADLGEAEEIYQRLEATAPPEMADEVAAFVVLAREVSTAFSPLGDDATDAQTQAVLDALSPEARAMVESIASAAATGELPEGPAGDVIGYGALVCPGG